VLVDIQDAAGQATLEKVKALGAEAAFVKADISRGKRAQIAAPPYPALATSDVVVNNAADFTQMSVEKAESFRLAESAGRERDWNSASGQVWRFFHESQGRIHREHGVDEC